jgi:cysteine synthase B
MIALQTQLPDINRRVNELQHYVGNTPLHEIKHLNPHKNVKVFAKMEWRQLGGSVKARPAYNIIRNALHDGLLTKGKTLLDATSGNTGIAYAIFCAVAGIDLTLCIPSNASKERKRQLEALKAKVIYTDPMALTEGAQMLARGIASEAPDKYYYADQYSNDNNWLAHYNTTSTEIWYQTRKKITHFISGLGTTGTFTGTGRRLRDLNPDVQLIALQPETALHGLEGWKHLETAGEPGIFDSTLADKVEHIDTEAAYNLMKDAQKFEGLSLSPSSAANLLGALTLAERLDEGVVVTILPDDASKYGDLTKSIFKN